MLVFGGGGGGVHSQKDIFPCIFSVAGMEYLRRYFKIRRRRTSLSVRTKVLLFLFFLDAFLIFYI